MNDNDSNIITEMEAQFKSTELSMDMDDEMFTQFHTLRDRIDDVSGLIEFKKSFTGDLDDRYYELNAMVKSLNETLREVTSQRRKVEDERHVLNREISREKEKLDDLLREFTRLKAELDARKKLVQQQEEMHLATIDAPWRKRAKPHQLEGAMRLSAAGRAVLGDAPGLGKTIQSIMTIDMLKGLGLAKKILIFCPKPVLDGFDREFKKWSPDHYIWILNQTGKGLKSEMLDVLKFAPECIILTNYEVWRKDRSIIEKFIECQFDTIILDEAHNLKDFKSSTAKGIKEIVHAENKCFDCGMLTNGQSTCPRCGKRPPKLFDNRSIKNVFPMTGTPILNRPQDLFTMLHLIDSVAFPNEDAFLRDFCRRICSGCGKSTNAFCTCDDGPRYRWVFREGGEKALLTKLGMKYTARTRESAGVEMPAQEDKHYYLVMDEKKHARQKKFIEMLRDQARIAFADGGGLTAFETLAWYSRMRQSAEWPDGIIVRDNRRDPITGELIGTGEIIWPRSPEDLPGQSVIMDWAEERIDEAVESGNRVVVFSHFKTSLKEMSRRLTEKGISHVRYDGDLNGKARIEAQHDFDLTVTRPENSKFKVMLAQYASAKVGLNLHGAHEIVFLGREWNPAMEEQAKDRVRRIGSEFETIVHIPHAEGTATELIDAIIGDKQRMLEGFEDEVKIAEHMRKYLKGDGK